jgi:hypothetical protein
MGIRKFSSPDQVAQGGSGISVSGGGPQPVVAGLSTVNVTPSQPKSRPAVMRISQPVNLNFNLKVAVAGQPAMAPAAAIPAGSTVRIRTSSSNVDTMYFADSEGRLTTGNGTPIDPDVEVIFPLPRGVLWFMGANVGDEASYSVRSA